MTSHTFEAELIRSDEPGAWTYLVIPFDVEKAFGSKGNVPVKGTFDGAAFTGTAMPLGRGRHMLVVNKEVRDKIRKEKGDVVTVVVEQDAAERTIHTPDDFARAIESNAKAREQYAGFSNSKKKEYVEWIEGAKQAETRARRIAQGVELIAQGRRLKV
jgi:hypothetical protein